MITTLIEDTDLCFIGGHEAERLLMVKGYTRSYLMHSSVFSPADMVLIKLTEDHLSMHSRECYV